VRELGFDHLDAIQYQSGDSAISIKRNRHLIRPGETATVCTYETPAVAFANPFAPLLERDEEYILSETRNPDLLTDLSRFFEQLFDAQNTFRWLPTSTREIAVTCGFRFDLSVGAGDTASPLAAIVPVLYHTRYPFIILTDYRPQSGSFVSELAQSVQTWKANKLTVKLSLYRRDKRRN
jgi:hypothetical protein